VDNFAKMYPAVLEDIVAFFEGKPIRVIEC
jgi:hypothetical protein